MNITQFPPPSADQSWYHYCYQAGLRGIPWEEVFAFANSEKKILRPKDHDNWFRGYTKNKDPFAIPEQQRVFSGNLNEFSSYPADHREPIDCYIPCNRDCKPLVKWSQTRCTEGQALAYRYCEILGLNLKGLHRVVIDVDGDHDGTPDWDVINYWSRFINYTHSRVKVDDQGRPISFHLEFYTTKVIPTMHFRKVDLLGNMNNQVQYLKPNKVENHLPMAPLDDYIWEELKHYVDESTRLG